MNLTSDLLTPEVDRTCPCPRQMAKIGVWEAKNGPPKALSWPCFYRPLKILPPKREKLRPGHSSTIIQNLSLRVDWCHRRRDFCTADKNNTVTADVISSNPQPAGRPNHTWLRAIEADLGPLNFGLATARRKATTRDKWRHILYTATLQWITLQKKKKNTLYTIVLLRLS